MSSAEDRNRSIQPSWRPAGRESRPGASQRANRLRILFVSVFMVGLVIVFLVLLFPRRTPPPLRYVGIGIGAYDTLPPNAGGQIDVLRLRGWFEKLHEAHGEAEFRTAPELDNSLSAQLPAELREKLGTADGEVLLVHCSAHAFVSPQNEGVQLLGIQAGLNSVIKPNPQVIPFNDLMRTLTETRARRVIVCLDFGRLTPDVRLGVLAEDALQQVAWDLENRDELRDSRVTIVTSCSPGETSATFTEDGAVRSVFGKALEEALQGACEGKGATGANDGVLTSAELFDYLQDSVRELSEQQTGVTQTVQMLGNQTPIDLMFARAVPEPEETEGDAEAPKASDDTGSNAAVADAPKTSDDEAKPAPVTSESVRARLLAAWKLRDGYRESSDIVSWMPHSWKSLQETLLRAEQHWLVGNLDNANQFLNAAEGLEELIDRHAGHRSLRDRAAWAELAISWGQIAGLGESPTAEQEQAFQALAQQLIERAAAPETPVAASPPGTPDFRDGPTRAQFARWLFEEATRRGGTRPLSQLLTILDQLNQREWSSRNWPAELVVLDQICRSADASPSVPRKTWTDLLELESRWHALLGAIALRRTHVPFAAAQLADAPDHLLAAQRWFSIGPAGQEQGSRSLERAKGALADAESEIRSQSHLWRLREVMLAELPGYAFWVAGLAEANGRQVDINELNRYAESLLNPATDRDMSSSSFKPLSGATQIERELLQRFEDAARISDSLAERTGESGSQVRLIAERMQQQWKSWTDNLRVDSFEGREARIALTNPWLTALDRQKLWSRVQGTWGPVRPVGDRPIPLGTWYAWWGIQSLRLVGATSDPDLQRQYQVVCQAWEDLVQSGGQTATQEIIHRTELGQSLADIWFQLSQIQRNEAFSIPLDARIRTAHGGDEIPTEANLTLDEIIQEQAWDSLQEALATYGRNWQRRTPMTGDWNSMTARLEAVRGRWEAADPDPKFKPIAEVVCDLNRQGTISIAADASPGRKLGVIALGADLDRVKLEASGELARFPVWMTQGALELEITIPPSQRQSIDLQLALIDENRLPVDFSDVRVVPPFDPHEWRIEFVTAQTQQPVYQLGFPRSSGLLGTRLFVPPDGAQASPGLIPMLVRPDGDSSKALNMVCSTRDPGGRPVVILSREIPLEADQSRVPLGIAAGGEAAPSPAAAIDVTGGMVFALTLDGNQAQTIEYHVLPEMWPAKQFIEDPVPVLENGTLSVPVRRAPLAFAETVDPLVPVAVPVELSLSPELEALKRGDLPLQIPALKADQGELLLTVEMDERRLQRALVQQYDRPSFEFSLSVAGWPHAYRWRADGTRLPKLVAQTDVPDLRILSPHHAAALKRESTDEGTTTVAVPVYLQVLLRNTVFSEGDRSRTWELDYSVFRGDSESGGRLRRERWSLNASNQREITVQPQPDGSWLLSATVKDFEDELALGAGVYTIVGRILRDGQQVGRQDATFSIDESPPELAIRHDVPETGHFVDQLLSVRATISDQESGVRSLVLGLDLDGSGKLEEGEPMKSGSVEELGTTFAKFQTVELFVPAKQLPQKPGKYALLVTGENRAGLVQTAKEEITLTKKPGPPPKETVELPTTGSIAVRVNRYYIAELRLVGPTKKEPVPLSSSKLPHQHTFGDLQPGDYRVELWRGGARVHQQTVKVTASKQPVPVTAP